MTTIPGKLFKRNSISFLLRLFPVGLLGEQTNNNLVFSSTADKIPSTSN